ncbi:MAG: ATP-binding protein [Desulfotignum sp.]
MPHRTQQFTMIQTEDAIDIRFSSCMENIDAVCRAVTRYLLFRLAAVQSPDHLFAVNLVMREGLTNAVRHGNKNDTAKEVRFRLKIVDDVSIHVEIEDQGNGFDWRKYRYSQFPLARDHGRGIFIMQTYCTRYGFNENGNILFLQKDFTF